LDSLFENRDTNLKEEFLEVISEFFGDGISRYIVPEVNSQRQEDFDSIVRDLKKELEILKSYQQSSLVHLLLLI
jgi:hypothetical protein